MKINEIDKVVVEGEKFTFISKSGEKEVYKGVENCAFVDYLVYNGLLKLNQIEIKKK